MDVLKDFGNGFVRVAGAFTESDYPSLTESHRAVQFEYGDVLLCGIDSDAALLIDDEEAVRHNIHCVHGNMDWVIVSICPNATEQQKDQLMAFLADYIVRLVDSVKPALNK